MFDYKKTLIPLPKKIEDGGATFKLADFQGMVSVEVTGTDDRMKQAACLISKRLEDLAMVTVDGDADFQILITTDPENDVFRETKSDEAYSLKVTEKTKFSLYSVPLIFPICTFCPFNQNISFK